MAIRFVDVDPGKAERDEPAPLSRARMVEPLMPDTAEARPAGGEAAADEDPLPHAKPEPKPRGRKKPMTAAPDRAEAAAAEPPAAPLLEGLLPEPLPHAKPAPKPRGRKKAFG